MLDIALFRDQPDKVRELLAARGEDPAHVDKVRAFDESRRSLVTTADAHRARRNEISKLIPQLAKSKQPIDDLKDESRRVGDEIVQIEEKLKVIEEEMNAIVLMLPNLPHSSTPRGKSPADNVVVRQWGEQRAFDFAAKPHWEVGPALGVLDLERGTKLSGSGFYVLRGAGARLERVLIQWMLDTHTMVNGYTEIAPPHLVSRKTMTGTGHLPKFEVDLYGTALDELFLIPTAEVPVTSLHRDEVLEEESLPLKYCAYTPCYRREAGGYGAETRGIARVHQFNKVEIVRLERPDGSYAAHEELTSHATWFLEQLGLTYRVLGLCAGDMGHAAAKCYDLEVWAPGMKAWLEVSSCSNFEEYQARRVNIRYKGKAGGKNTFVHTLNGSALALPRLVIAILETYQRADGSVELPAVLHERMGMPEIR